jgi:hypothetical protein
MFPIGAFQSTNENDLTPRMERNGQLSHSSFCLLCVLLQLTTTAMQWSRQSAISRMSGPHGKCSGSWPPHRPHCIQFALLRPYATPFENILEAGNVYDGDSLTYLKSVSRQWSVGCTMNEIGPSDWLAKKSTASYANYALCIASIKCFATEAADRNYNKNSGHGHNTMRFAQQEWWGLQVKRRSGRYFLRGRRHTNPFSPVIREGG